jgi:hypothetical protein
MRFEFEGGQIEFIFRGVGHGMTAEEVAEFLGFSSHKRVTELFNRHEKEFKPGETWFEIVVTAKPQNAVQTRRGRPERIFGHQAILRLAMLGSTDRCVKARDKMIYDVLPEFVRLKDGASKDRVASLEEEVANLRADLRLSVRTNAQMGKIASTLMTERKKAKRVERDAELFATPRLALGATDGLSPLDEKILASLATEGPADTVADLAKRLGLGNKIAMMGEAVALLHQKGHVKRVDGKIALAERRPQSGDEKRSAS